MGVNTSILIPTVYSLVQVILYVRNISANKPWAEIISLLTQSFKWALQWTRKLLRIQWGHRPEGSLKVTNARTFFHLCKLRVLVFARASVRSVVQTFLIDQMRYGVYLVQYFKKIVVSVSDGSDLNFGESRQFYGRHMDESCFGRKNLTFGFRWF